MSMLQRICMKDPAHPGGFVRSEIIEALGLSVTDAASALGVTRALGTDDDFARIEAAAEATGVFD